MKNKRHKKILLRPSIEIEDLISVLPKLSARVAGFDKESISQAGIQIKYEVYIEKEKELVQRMSQLEELEIPESFDYKKNFFAGKRGKGKAVKN